MEFSTLKNKTLIDIKVEDDNIVFTTSNNEKYQLFHDQDCCEYVYIEDVCGDINDLLNHPILVAEESTNIDLPPVAGSDESYTWTFYKLDTIKGGVTIRFFGSSNGCYSESVNFRKL